MSLEFRLIVPAAALRRVVRHYWVLAGDGLAEDAHPIFPDGCAELVFNLGPVSCELLPSGETLRQPHAMLVGQMTRPVQVVPGKAMRMVGVKLAPWGAAAILGPHGARVRDAVAALGDVGSAQLTRLGDRLDGCASDPEIAAVLDHALGARVDLARPAAMARLERLAGAVDGTARSLDAWAGAMGCSARTLEREFDHFVGLSPKELARLYRFQRALKLSSAHPTMTWASIAAVTGYSDQAHLGRDFRQFAGAAPTSTTSARTVLSEAFIGGVSDSH